jgi:hypothetical protein
MYCACDRETPIAEFRQACTAMLKPRASSIRRPSRWPTARARGWRRSRRSRLPTSTASACCSGSSVARVVSQCHAPGRSPDVAARVVEGRAATGRDARTRLAVSGSTRDKADQHPTAASRWHRAKMVTSCSTCRPMRRSAIRTSMSTTMSNRRWASGTPRDKVTMKAGLTSHMRGLQPLPEKVRSYFHAADVRYAA